MRIHHLQHVAFEGLGSMQARLTMAGGGKEHSLRSTQLYLDEPLPEVNDLDWLIVMGGPMSIHDEKDYPWLKQEKRFIRDCIKQGKKVLGICLGAQLIAEALGADIVPNQSREIGWFPLTINPALQASFLKDVFPSSVDAFHWHGEVFSLPEGSVAVGSSIACANQGFIVDDRVAAFQFHLETTLESASALIQHCGDELDDSAFVQNAEEILGNPKRFDAINKTMERVLMAFEALP